MLNFKHFESEYTRICKLLGIVPDDEVIDLYYEAIRNFTNTELTEAFFEARVTMTKMPKPIELRKLRDLIASRSAPATALPFAEIKASPCPQYLKDMMKACDRCRSRFGKYLSKEQIDILEEERKFIFGPSSPYRPGAIVEAEFVSVAEF